MLRSRVTTVFTIYVRTNSENVIRQKKKPPKYWNDKKNIILFLNQLQQKLELNSEEEWDSITSRQIISNGGFSLIKKYSLHELKQMGYPNGNFKVRKPTKHWENIENIKLFLQDIKNKLNIKDKNDWNLITKEIIRKHGGASILNNYSVYQLKCLACPEGEHFFSNPNKPGFWKKEENIQKFLNILQKELNLYTFNDWNSLTQQQIKDLGGNRLLKLYSMYEIKCMALPERKDDFTLPNIPNSFWDSEQNIQNFIKRLSEKYNVNTSDDWNRISNFQIRSFGGGGLFVKYSKDELVKYLPKIKEKNKSRVRSSQRWLFLQIQQLFPGEEIVEDYFHPEISRESGFAVQFDVYLVEKKIAFEYHGKQHYEDIPSGFASIEMYKFRDKEKAILCQQFGIQLVIIPHWWDNTFTSLKMYVENNFEIMNKT